MQPNQDNTQNPSPTPAEPTQQPLANFIVYSEAPTLVASTPMVPAQSPVNRPPTPSKTPPTEVSRSIEASSLAVATESMVAQAVEAQAVAAQAVEPEAQAVEAQAVEPIEVLAPSESDPEAIEESMAAMAAAIEEAMTESMTEVMMESIPVEEIPAVPLVTDPTPVAAIKKPRRGIYITANDKVIEHAIALLKSIRQYDPETPVVLIPYDDHYTNIAATLEEQFGVTLYPDLEFIDRLSQHLFEIFGRNFFARPNQFRKQACWFGDFDEFLYIDTDIVVFEKIIDNLNYLKDYDFLACDYQHLGGIKNVFTPKIVEDGIFTEADLRSIFNGGWWAAKKGAIQEADLYESFAECSKHREWFDFSQKTSDQPIINYMILKKVAKRLNLVQQEGGAPGSWAGSTHFIPEGDDRLYDPTCDQPLQYLHWAGIRIEPGCPYWEIWAHYRYLNEPMPKFEIPVVKKASPLKQWVRKIKR
ncbi:MAG: hypothetical protein VKJ24_01090 [Synechococcales bacterium]|nr:hypothetical protein [Synechococcales bacterium]